MEWNAEDRSDPFRTGWYESPELTMPPSEYFKRNCWISVEADEVTVRQFVETFGGDRLIFSTDYPPAARSTPHAADTFDMLPLPEETKAEIVSTNWQAPYDIPLVKRI